MNKLILFFLIIALLLLSLFTYIITNRNNNNTKIENYKGIVVKKETDKANRDETYIYLIDSTNDTLLLPTIYWEANLWLYTDIGDSLIKKTNSFTIIIKKSNNIIKTAKYDTKINDTFYIFLFWILLLIGIFLIRIFKED